MQARMLILAWAVVATACFDPLGAPASPAGTDSDSDIPPESSSGCATSVSLDGSTFPPGETTTTEDSSSVSGGTDPITSTSDISTSTDDGESSEAGGCPTAVFGAAVFGQACVG